MVQNDVASGTSTNLLVGINSGVQVYAEVPQLRCWILVEVQAVSMGIFHDHSPLVVVFELLTAVHSDIDLV